MSIEKKQWKFPNVPKFVGKVIGKIIHVPVDVACGIKEGVTGTPCGGSKQSESGIVL